MNRQKSMQIAVLLKRPPVFLKTFKSERKINLPRGNPGAARHPRHVWRGTIPGHRTPRRPRSPARCAGAGAAFGTKHAHKDGGAKR